jgi:hypothetical protein
MFRHLDGPDGWESSKRKMKLRKRTNRSLVPRKLLKEAIRQEERWLQRERRSIDSGAQGGPIIPPLIVLSLWIIS